MKDFSHIFEWIVKIMLVISGVLCLAAIVLTLLHRNSILYSMIMLTFVSVSTLLYMIFQKRVNFVKIQTEDRQDDNKG
jgi:hypothetical protein